MRICLETHGCRLNQAEGDALERVLAAAGHEVVAASEAEVFVLNTCTITHAADADARKRIRAVARQRPDAAIVVTGCYANAQPQAAAALEGVRLVVGNAEKERFVEVLEEALVQAPRPKGPPLVAVTALTRHLRSSTAKLAPLTLPAAPVARRARAFLKIQDGCNYTCSFCIVPQVRGKNRSYQVSQVLDNFDEVVAAGRAEVVLTGVHLGTFGWDHGDRQGLPNLVEQLVSRRHAARIRLGSLDPHEVRQPLVELMARHGGRGLCRHLHLPVQSGSDAILSAMRRAHRRSHLDALVPILRERVPGLALGTDIIVGFPGESDDDFAATASLFDEDGLDYAHVFTYSRRHGTRAAELPGQVDEAIKRQRNAVIRQRAQQRWQRFTAAAVGQELDVVAIERNGQGHWIGLTDHYIEVDLGPLNLRKGQALAVALRAGKDGLLGVPL